MKADICRLEPQGSLLHIRKSLISVSETDLCVNISQIGTYKVGRGSLRLRFFPEHERGSTQEREVRCGVSGAAAALILQHRRIAWMVIFVFHGPAVAHFLQDPCWWFVLATAQVNALSVGSLASFLFCGLTLDLRD